MQIDCISDLHGFLPKNLLGGDLLIIAGDLTAKDTPLEHLDILEWVKHQPYKEKIVIAGNHDNFIHGLKSKYIAEVQTLSNGMKYLCDSSTEFEELKIFGSPWTLAFPGINPHCKAFTVDTEEQLAEKWAVIPDNIDILITHSPPNGIFDSVKKSNKYIYCGSTSLRNEVMYRVQPKIHIFGHIHEHGGKMVDLITTKFINASIMNERYEPVNKHVRIQL